MLWQECLFLPRVQEAFIYVLLKSWPVAHVEPSLCRQLLRHSSAEKTVSLYVSFYCEKYTYHFLTIAICWCHPTHWPTLRNVLRNLKRPVSECELACPPSGHVTTLVNNSSLNFIC